MENKSAKRIAFLIASGIDMLLGAFGLFLYLGILRFDLDGLRIPRWMVGATGAVLLLLGVAVFSYILSTPGSSE